jgi:DNA replication protein DnaC
MNAEPAKGEREVCDRCFGTGLEVVPGKGARRCDCRTPDPAKLFTAAKVPERHVLNSFANYRPAPNNGSQLKAFNYAFRLASDFPSVERGLLFMGPCGVGKTHLMVATIRRLCEKGAACLFKDFGALLKEIQATYDAQRRGLGERDVLAAVYDAEVLLLDELGAQRPTEWAVDILTLVISERYKKKKLTLATTNCADGEPRWGFPTLEERIGARARSRLKEMCRTVVVEGEDYRDRFDERR